jgi:hypothetical protein
MKQRFSVAVHPTLQLLLFSDGYMVTAVELSDGARSFSCLQLTQTLASLAEARLQQSSYLRHWLRSSFFERSSVVDDASRARRRGLARASTRTDSRSRNKYAFETTPSDADDDADDLPVDGGVFRANSGKVIFGDFDNMMKTSELQRYGSIAENGESGNFVELCSKELIFAWGLMTTHSGVWTVDHETVAENVVRSTVRLFSAILDNDERDGLSRVLSLFRRFLELASNDCLGQHLLIVSTTFVHRTAELLLRAKILRRISCPAVLHGVSLAIRFAERHFARTYAVKPAPFSRRTNALPYSCSLDTVDSDVYCFPVSFMATEHLSKNKSALQTLRMKRGGGKSVATSSSVTR